MAAGEPAAGPLLAPEPLPPELAAGLVRRRELIRAAARQSLRRRQLTRSVAEALSALAVAVCLVPLVAMLGYTVSRGGRALGLGFLVHNPTPPGVPGGGIFNAIAGSVLIVGLASLMAIPVGVAAALFLLERRGRLAAALRFGAGVLAGIPSIAIGIFAAALLVQPLAHFSALAGAFAIGVLMLPIVVRASEVVLLLVPGDLREAALALGAPRWRAIARVILPTALPGMVTGVLLAIARAAGETAPLLFTAGATLKTGYGLNGFMNSLPVQIYSDVTSATTSVVNRAWGAALTLVAMILVLNLVARLVARRSRIA